MGKVRQHLLYLRSAPLPHQILDPSAGALKRAWNSCSSSGSFIKYDFHWASSASLFLFQLETEVAAIRDAKRRDAKENRGKTEMLFLYLCTSLQAGKLFAGAGHTIWWLRIVITKNGSLQFPTWRIINAIPHLKLSTSKEATANNNHKAISQWANGLYTLSSSPRCL